MSIKRKMRRIVNLTGKRFYRWVVQGYSHYENKNHYWSCICDCGTLRLIPTRILNGTHSKSCGCYRRDLCKSQVGAKAPNWKNSKTKGSDGYIQMRYPETGKRVYEQRYVMEQYLGRPLFSNENVHHKNGIRDDNRIENLELWIKPQPGGIRLVDAIEYWTKQLRHYAPERLV